MIDWNYEGKGGTPVNKFGLKDYLKKFDLHDPIQLERKSGEIMDIVRKIMEPYVKGERGEPLRAYYAPAVKLIEEAYDKKDFEKEFPSALDFMICSVDWE